MKSIKYLILASLILPATASAWQWVDLWRTADQQGSKLLQSGQAQAAAQVFKDRNWQSVSHYRSGNYPQAFKQFSATKTSDGQYNAGNAAAYMERYQDAIAAYDKAIALNSANADAITNREIIKKLLQQKQQQQQNQQQKQNNTSSNKQQQPLANKAKQNKPDNGQNMHSQATATSKQQRQDENNKQLLRRLPDDPGGLLQQKFLRDYARRHGVEENLDQGMN